MNHQPDFHFKGSLQNGQDQASAQRRLRGMEIAATVKIGKNTSGYIVPSESGKGFYLVKVDDAPSCTCADFELRQRPCKHLYAVMFVIERDEPAKDLPESGRQAQTNTTRRDWSTYNLAQAQEGKEFPNILRALCDTVPQPSTKVGRPRLPLGDMVYAVGLRVYSGLSCRRAMSEISEAQEKGHLKRAPSLASVFRYLENPDLTPVLERLIVRSALPLREVETAFAIDASGFSSSEKDSWYENKWGNRVGIGSWVKGHICSGVETNIVAAALATLGNANDSPFFGQLLETTAQGFRISCISADKAYSSRKNLRVAERLGAQVRIPFKSNAVPFTEKQKRDPVWERNLKFFNEHRAEFLDQYHKRSNVEATFSMVKAKFGGWVRSKTPTAQMNELLLKILCHNVVVLVKATYELGIEPSVGPDSAEGDYGFPLAA